MGLGPLVTEGPSPQPAEPATAAYCMYFPILGQAEVISLKLGKVAVTVPVRVNRRGILGCGWLGSCEGER